MGKKKEPNSFLTFVYLSTITLRGGGANLFPGSIMVFLESLAGILGGHSLMTRVGGVSGGGGCCRMRTGGAGG